MASYAVFLLSVFVSVAFVFVFVCCILSVVFAFVLILVTRRTRSGKEVAEVVVRHLEVEHKEVIRLQSGRHFDILRKLIRLPSRMLLLNVDFGVTDIHRLRKWSTMFTH